MNGPLNIHPKTTGASLSGALGILIVWLLTALHVAVSPEASGAIVIALAGLGSYLAPLAKSEKPAP